MSSEYEIAETLDVKGLNCPMPIVKAKQAIDDLEPGEVLEVLATDPGSVPDFQGWADTTGSVALLDQTEAEENGESVYKHYVRRGD